MLSSEHSASPFGTQMGETQCCGCLWRKSFVVGDCFFETIDYYYYIRRCSSLWYPVGNNMLLLNCSKNPGVQSNSNYSIIIVDSSEVNMDLPFTQQRGQPLIFDFARQAGGFQIFGFDAMPGAL